MRKFAPTKTFKTPSKSFKTTTKTIKRLQIPKTRSLCFLMFLNVFGNMQKNGNFKPSASFLQSSHGIMFLEEAWSWLQVWTLCVCVCVCAHHHADWDARLILWETIWNQAFSMSEIYNQFRGSGNDKKIKVAVEGIKLTTGFWRYRPKRLLFELASRKSRTLGVDQNFLIFWRPRYVFAE